MAEGKPYVVVTNKGVLLSEHATIEQAQQAAENANERAAQLGIETRYEAKSRIQAGK